MAQEFLSRENYYFSQTPAKVPGARIIRVAHEKWGANYNVYRPNSIAIGLAYVLKGKATYETETNKWILSKGHIASFGPGPAYTLICDPKVPLEVMIIAYCGSEQIELTQKCLGGTCLIVDPMNKPEIITIFEKVFSTAKGQRLYSEEICNSLIPHLLWTIKRGLSESLVSNSPSISKYLACKQYIDNHFLQIKSMSDVLKINHTSHAHLCRIFKQYAQTTPNLYCLKLKINHASHLLQYTEESIKTIASDLGFSDQYVFSKTFKRLVGTSPQKFRLAKNNG